MSEHPWNIGRAHPECGVDLVHQDKPLDWFVGKYVKKRFVIFSSGPRDPTHERMWVKILSVEGGFVEGGFVGRLVGTLDNDPLYDCGAVCGDEVRVAQNEIIGVEG